MINFARLDNSHERLSQTDGPFFLGAARKEFCVCCLHIKYNILDGHPRRANMLEVLDTKVTRPAGPVKSWPAEALPGLTYVRFGGA